jgi:hypothetical protein
MQGRTTFEERYLQGFAEYLYATDLEGEGDFTAAVGALERAWGLLRIFSSARADTALQVLEYRFGAYEAASARLSRGPLFAAAGYLQSPPRMQISPFADGRDRGVWVDPFHDAILLGAQLAMAGQSHDVLVALRAAPERLAGGSGNRRKYEVIRARAIAGVGTRSEAREAWQTLLDDPVYSNEAGRELG